MILLESFLAIYHSDYIGHFFWVKWTTHEHMVQSPQLNKEFKGLRTFQSVSEAKDRGGFWQNTQSDHPSLSMCMTKAVSKVRCFKLWIQSYRWISYVPESYTEVWALQIYSLYNTVAKGIAPDLYQKTQDSSSI